MNRYQPRTQQRRAPQSSLTALEVLRRGKDMYGDVEVGDEMGVSPEVFLSSQSDRLNDYAGGIADKRQFTVGAGKMGYVVGKDMGWFKKAGKKAGGSAGSQSMMSKLLGNKALPKGVDAYGQQIAATPSTGLRNVGGKAASMIAKGGSELYAGAKVGIGNVAAGTPFAGAGAGSSALATAGAVAAPLLAAIAASKIIGSTKAGKKWNKGTNKWLKKATGTGRSKNLLSPWKWRL
tara:strand:- start:9942 stop:10643 length:702 start_codon:yes stop_codon:yes gene_type:complete